MTEEIKSLRDYFHNASKAAEYMSYAFLSIKNDLDEIIVKHKTRVFTRTILVTAFVLIALTLLLR